MDQNEMDDMTLSEYMDTLAPSSEFVQEVWPDAQSVRWPVIHLCPPKGSGEMPCCDRTPFEVPITDLMTLDVSVVTCGED